MASQCGRRNLRGRQGTALLLGLCLAAFALLPSAFRDLASAQGESRPVTLVVGFPAGSGTLDAIARIMREWLTRKWMQPVIVDNIPGLSGSAGAETVFRAPPDGRTLLITPPGLLTIARHLQPLAFDPDQFVRVSLLATTPIVLVARRDLPAADLRELVAYAREHPGKLMAANQGQGSTSHLTAVAAGRRRARHRARAVSRIGGGVAGADRWSRRSDVRQPREFARGNRERSGQGVGGRIAGARTCAAECRDRCRVATWIRVFDLGRRDRAAEDPASYC